MPLIAFECDATPDVGYGHLSRCLALAEAFRQLDHGSIFLGRIDGGGRKILDDSGFPSQAASLASRVDAMEEGLRSTGAVALVVDRYGIEIDGLRTLKAKGWPVLLIDDFGILPDYPVNAVLNFTFGAQKLNYRTQNARLLLGVRYLPVRRSLVDVRRRRKSLKDEKSGKRVLVAMGGSDIHGFSLPVVKLLLERDVQTRVVAGRATKEIAELADLERQNPDRISLVVDAPGLAPHLEWADTAICGGGLTKYEAAFVGLPCAVLSQTPGQADDTRLMAECGLCVDFADGTSGAFSLDAMISVLADGGVRKELSHAADRAFPDDPALEAARALLEVVQTAPKVLNCSRH